jgi:molybdopterin converting factor small subunit
LIIDAKLSDFQKSFLPGKRDIIQIQAAVWRFFKGERDRSSCSNPTPLKSWPRSRMSSGHGKTVGEVLCSPKPIGLQERLRDNEGMRRFINIYVNDEDIRFIQNLGTPLKEGDQISIIPAIAGGAFLREGHTRLSPNLIKSGHL